MNEKQQNHQLQFITNVCSSKGSRKTNRFATFSLQLICLDILVTKQYSLSVKRVTILVLVPTPFTILVHQFTGRPVFRF